MKIFGPRLRHLSLLSNVINSSLIAYTEKQHLTPTSVLGINLSETSHHYFSTHANYTALQTNHLKNLKHSVDLIVANFALSEGFFNFTHIVKFVETTLSEDGIFIFLILSRKSKQVLNKFLKNYHLSDENLLLHGLEIEAQNFNVFNEYLFHLTPHIPIHARILMLSKSELSDLALEFEGYEQDDNKVEEITESEESNELSYETSDDGIEEGEEQEPDEIEQLEFEDEESEIAVVDVDEAEDNEFAYDEVESIEYGETDFIDTIPEEDFIENECAEDSAKEDGDIENDVENEKDNDSDEEDEEEDEDDDEEDEDEEDELDEVENDDDQELEDEIEEEQIENPTEIEKSTEEEVDTESDSDSESESDVETEVEVENDPVKESDVDTDSEGEADQEPDITSEEETPYDKPRVSG